MSDEQQLSLHDSFEASPGALLTPDEIFKRLDDASFLARLEEDKRIEKKPASFSGESLGEYISMWANTPPKGGIILIGVSNDGTFEGLARREATYLNKLEKVGQTYCPAAKVMTKRVPVNRPDGQDDFVLAIRVEYLMKRVAKTTKGRAFIRRGDSKYEVAGEEFRELQADKKEVRFETESSCLTYPGDFDIKLIRRFTAEVASTRELDNTHAKEDILQLQHLGEITAGGFEPNIACTLIFAQDPRKEVPGCYLRFLRFDGDEEGTGDKWNAVKDVMIEGDVPKIIVEADRLIKSQIRTFSRLDKNERFRPQPEYPRTAWYEAVVNACVHRSYGDGLKNTGIFVKMFDSRLLIESPGPFPPFVTPENIYDSHNPRNPWLMEAMHSLDFVKCAHEGTRRIRASMNELSLPDPEFEEKEVGNFLVRVTLRNNVHQRKVWVDHDVTELIGSLLARDLGENEKRFVNYVAEHDEISVSDAQRLSHLGWHTAKKVLMRLVDRGILIRDGREDLDRDPKARFRLNQGTE